MDNLLKTFLCDTHLELSAKMVEFGGYLMPLQYSSISDEHFAVREHAGLFDVSHMGLVVISGPDTNKFVNYVLTSNVKTNNKIVYGLLLNKAGNIIDDLMAYPFSDDQVMLVLNAANTKKDFDHLNKLSLDYKVDIRLVNQKFGCIALQGPKSEDFLTNYINNLPKHSSEYLITDSQGGIIVSRSGYTGEDGFEIYGTHSYLEKLWSALIKDGVTPTGLGARDTLRFEAAMPLYGQEMDETVNPLEAGLKFALDMTKEFYGKSALPDVPTRRVVGLELLDKNIARTSYGVYVDDQKVGYITSGYLSLSTKRALALAMIDSPFNKIGTHVYIKIRNKMVKAIVRNKKFIEKKNNI